MEVGARQHEAPRDEAQGGRRLVAAGDHRVELALRRKDHDARHDREPHAPREKGDDGRRRHDDARQEGGRKIAAGAGPAPACATCHGIDLRGVGLVPPIAGRSPTYILRQLLAFRTGARATPAGAAMTPAVADLGLDDMVAVAAYVASRGP